MTAGLTLGADARVYPLNGNVPNGLPALRQVQGAGAVRVAVKTQGKHATGLKISPGKPRDWLTLLVKEELGSRFSFAGVTKTQAPSGLIVDLKYVTTEQKFTLEYEGGVSFFEVDAISPQSYDTNEPGDLTPQLQGLKISPVTQIWTVGWDTTVVIVPADTPKPLDSVNV